MIADLLNHPELEQVEIEGLLRLLMVAGRDSAAYLITTGSVALLTDPDQLRDAPEPINPAVEEFMRVGAMFVTLFARTTTEDVVIDGTVIPAGTSVSVSLVAADRDPAHWEVISDSVTASMDASASRSRASRSAKRSLRSWRRSRSSPSSTPSSSRSPRTDEASWRRPHDPRTMAGKHSIVHFAEQVVD